MLFRDAGCKRGVPCGDLLPAGSVGRGSPLTVPRSSVQPSRRPWPTRPRCLTPASFRCLQGIKKPYNPILGETFRCCWFHPQTNSHTFYIAEQARATPGWAPGSAVGRPWWRVGGASAQACFWAAQPWTVGRSLASLLPGGFSQGCRPHRGCDSRVSLGRAQRVPSSWGPLGGTREWQAVPGPSPKMRLPSHLLLGLGEMGGPGLPAAGAVARPASPPTGLPPPTRVRLPCQQPEGRLLHQRQHHRQVPVLR